MIMYPLYRNVCFVSIIKRNFIDNLIFDVTLINFWQHLQFVYVIILVNMVQNDEKCIHNEILKCALFLLKMKYYELVCNTLAET